MKAELFLIFLTATLTFSQPALAGEAEIGVTYPFTDAGGDVLISSPYMEESFLGFLRENSVYPVMDSDGIPLLYYSEDGNLGCRGVCSNISMNSYILGSKTLNDSGLLAAETLKESVVVGNRDIEGTMDTINSIRASLADNPEALAEFERHLLEEQEGYLRSVYFENAYSDVWDYALEEIKKNPGVYRSLMKHVSMKDIEGSIGDLEEFLNENFDISEAYDLSSLFSAIESRKIGQAQLGEFMRNVLERISEEGGIDLDLDDIDLEGFSDLLRSEEFRNAMERAMEMIEENPEMFDNLKELADEMLSRPETRDVFKEAVKEMLKNADWDSVKRLMELFGKIENKQQMLEALMEGISEHMREMAESGMIDSIREQLESAEMRTMLMEAAQGFSGGVMEDLNEWIEETPMLYAYIIAVLAVIATLIILVKIKI
jgi:lipoate-protein ligase A